MKNKITTDNSTRNNNHNMNTNTYNISNEPQGCDTPTRNSNHHAMRFRTANRNVKYVTSLNNVSHLSYKPASWLFDKIIDQIENRKYIKYRCKRFTIRCQMVDDGMKSLNSKINLDFEIEVVELAESIIEQARQKQVSIHF